MVRALAWYATFLLVTAIVPARAAAQAVVTVGDSTFIYRPPSYTYEDLAEVERQVREAINPLLPLMDAEGRDHDLAQILVLTLGRHIAGIQGLLVHHGTLEFVKDAPDIDKAAAYVYYVADAIRIATEFDDTMREAVATLRPVAKTNTARSAIDDLGALSQELMDMVKEHQP